MSGQALPAARRIRRRPEFERAYKEGARVHGRFLTLFVRVNGGTVPRVGIAATRKVGSAVDRNRTKRLSRELFRRSQTIAGLDVVVVPRREMLDAPFDSLEADYRSALERGGRQARSRAPGQAERPVRPRRPKDV